MATSVVSFSDIEQRVSKLLEREEIDPVIPKPNALEERSIQTQGAVVAGLPVSQDARLEQWYRERKQNTRAQIQQFRAQRGRLTVELERQNVTPLAVLPWRTWKNIASKHHLLCLAPDEEGCVRVNPLWLMEIHHAPIVLIGKIVAVCVWIAGIVLCVVYGDYLISATALLSIVIVLLMRLYEQEHPFWTRPERTRNVKRFFAATPAHAHRVDALLSDEHIGWIAYGDSVRQNGIRVIFPTPETDLSPVLARTYTAVEGELGRYAVKNQVMIAAPAAAIQFGQDLAAYLIDPTGTPVHTSEAAEASCDGDDPIVFVRHGEAVAIIAAYGNCIWEKQAVDAALEERPFV